MAQTTYTITRGQQYDRNGVQVVTTDANGRSRWASYGADCQWAYGASDLARQSQESGLDPAGLLTDAIARVQATGEAETLALGVTATVVAATRTACARYSASDGCPLHGETCRP